MYFLKHTISTRTNIDCEHVPILLMAHGIVSAILLNTAASLILKSASLTHNAWQTHVLPFERVCENSSTVTIG